MAPLKSVCGTTLVGMWSSTNDAGLIHLALCLHERVCFYTAACDVPETGLPAKEAVSPSKRFQQLPADIYRSEARECMVSRVAELTSLNDRYCGSVDHDSLRYRT